MGRKTQVTKEQLLEAGLQIVIRSGYSAVSIKTVAAEFGCSTSPIVWSFENIDNYRRELRIYAKQYMDRKMLGDGSNVTDDHRKTGFVYVDMALDEPNLLRYLRINENELQASGGIGFIFNSEKNVLLQQTAVKGLVIYFTACVFAGFNIILSVYFTSTEFARPAHVISLLRGFFVIIPMAFFLSYLFGMTGVWLAFPVTELLVSILGGILFFRHNRS